MQPAWGMKAALTLAAPRKRAQLLSTTGALVLGIGLGVMLAGALQAHAALIVLVGATAHVIGMVENHRLEQREGPLPRWADGLYWLCWLALAALVLAIVAGARVP
jgi:hypothetical protein